jgi:hypothetical protein
MAVCEGARPTTTFVPRRRLEAPLLRPQAPAFRRRRQRVAIRARRRPRTVGFVIGGIVVVFLLSFFSLVQTVRVSASSFDMGRLEAEYARLQNERQQVLSDIDRLGRESAVRRQAIAEGLTALPAPIVLPAP